MVYTPILFRTLLNHLHRPHQFSGKADRYGEGHRGIARIIEASIVDADHASLLIEGRPAAVACAYGYDVQLIFVACVIFLIAQRLLAANNPKRSPPFSKMQCKWPSAARYRFGTNC